MSDATHPLSAAVRVTVNGNPVELAVGTTLAGLIVQLGHEPQAVATAVNGEFVARHARVQRLLAEGAQVTCFQPIVGG
jgi:sulfur carrier protein